MKTDFIDQFLLKKEACQQLRNLKCWNHSKDNYLHQSDCQKLNFSSNNYLGLADHPQLIENAIRFTKKYGVGSRSSRLVCGHHSYHEALEKKLASYLGTETSLIFASGFQTNIAVLSALADRHTHIFMDKASHNSLVQGAKLSEGHLHRFRHNDMEHLEKLLKTPLGTGRKIIVTESIFSMDGDRAPLEALRAISKKYDCFLYVDDAHALGVEGTHGMGLAAHQPFIDLIVGGFGKGAGCFGGYLGCSNRLKQYFINSANGFIYTTAIPPSLCGAIDAALDLIPQLTEDRYIISQLSKSLKKALMELGLPTGLSTTHIIPLMIKNDALCLKLAEWLEDHHVIASPIRPPTVPVGQARLRFSLTSKHTQENLLVLIDLLKRWKTFHG